MKRRNFDLMLLGVAVTWPATGRAQTPSRSSGSCFQAQHPAQRRPLYVFKLGLEEAGYIDG